MIYPPVLVARMLSFVREASDEQNTGQRVEAIQHWSGGIRGDSWCAHFVTMVLDIAYQGKAPIPRLGACQDIYELAQRKGWITDKPKINDLFIYVNENNHAHHVGFVTGLAPLCGIAGNTSADGISSNGNGVYEHVIRATTFVHYQT